MKITFLVTGKLQESYLAEGVTLYLKRLKHYTNIELLEVNATGSIKDPSRQLAAEAKIMLGRIPSHARLYLLDDKGKTYSSPELAGFLQEHMNHSVRELVFMTGGAYGFAPECHERADGLISLSRLTFSHQMVRLIFLEQLYRAFTIIKGEKYHH